MGCGARYCRDPCALGWAGAGLSESTFCPGLGLWGRRGRMCAGVLPVGSAVCTWGFSRGGAPCDSLYLYLPYCASARLVNSALTLTRAEAAASLKASHL